jgi:hypothetical protein
MILVEFEAAVPGGRLPARNTVPGIADKALD